MGKLIFGMVTSLDGYVADAAGDFGWAEPDDELHQHFNDTERTIGTFLYGRRMYETMSYWADPPGIDDEPAVMREYAQIWQAADKIVYSSTLPAASTPRTRLKRAFDADAVRALKASSPRDITIGGPALAASALRAGLVDECHVYLAPVSVGGGTRFFPGDLRLSLELISEREFAQGVVMLRYRVAN